MSIGYGLCSCSAGFRKIAIEAAQAVVGLSVGVNIVGRKKRPPPHSTARLEAARTPDYTGYPDINFETEFTTKDTSDTGSCLITDRKL